MAETCTVRREEFLSAFMRRGLTYVQAVSAYEGMCEAVESGVISGSRINIGRVGCLEPSVRQPRTIKMGFERQGSEVKKIKRTYYIDRRVTYRLRIYRRFMATRALNWS